MDADIFNIRIRKEYPQVYQGARTAREVSFDQTLPHKLEPPTQTSARSHESRRP